MDGESQFVDVAALADLAPDTPRHVVVDGRHLVVALLEDGAVIAISAICPHAMGDFAGGLIARGQIICPMHHYRYDLRTGACAWPQGEGGRLTRFETQTRDGRVWVRAPQPAWW